MARIIRRRVFLRGKARRRKLQLLHIATVPGPPPAGIPNKDFYTLTKRRPYKKKKKLIRRGHKRRQRQLLQLLFLASKPSSVLVPDVRNTLLPSAEATLTNKGLGWHITFAPSLLYPFDIVISQSPLPTTSVAIGTVVELLVSSGSVVLPNELNKPIDVATAALVALGLLPQITQKPTDKVAPGLVTKQIPGPAQNVLVGSVVFLEVSAEPPLGATRSQLPSLNDIVNVVTVVQ